MKRRALVAPLALAFAAAAFLTAPQEAAAFERQWHAGMSLGYGLLTGNGLGASGVAGGLHVAYGLTDAFNVIGYVDASGHFGDKLFVPSVSTGLSYTIDITQVVGYLGLTAGAADIITMDKTACAAPGASCHKGKLALGIPWGIDYQLSRGAALGVVGHYQMLVIGDSPLSHITVGAHFEVMWGY